MNGLACGAILGTVVTVTVAIPSAHLVSGVFGLHFAPTLAAMMLAVPIAACAVLCVLIARFSSQSNG